MIVSHWNVYYSFLVHYEKQQWLCHNFVHLSSYLIGKNIKLSLVTLWHSSKYMSNSDIHQTSCDVTMVCRITMLNMDYVRLQRSSTGMSHNNIHNGLCQKEMCKICLNVHHDLHQCIHFVIQWCLCDIATFIKVHVFVMFKKVHVTFWHSAMVMSHSDGWHNH